MSRTPDVERSAQRASRSALKTTALVVGVIAVIAILFVLSVGSGWLILPQERTEEPGQVASNPPEILSITPSTDRIVPLSTVAISCYVSHDDVGHLAYEWSSTAGELRGSGSEIQWVAPDAEGLHRVYVRVTDLHGGIDELSLALFVRSNTPPVIIGMYAEVDDDPGWVIPGAVIEVYCEAVDEDGDDLVYAWSATAGVITGRGPSVTWTAPDETGLHWITVDVTDGYDGSARRAIPVSVSRGEPPTILGFKLEPINTRQFEPYDDGWVILGEKSCSIEVLVEGDDSGFTYDWQSDRGEVVGDGPIAVFEAPPTGTSVVVVRVINEMGSEASGSVRIGTWSFSCCG